MVLLTLQTPSHLFYLLEKLYNHNWLWWQGRFNKFKSQTSRNNMCHKFSLPNSLCPKGKGKNLPDFQWSRCLLANLLETQVSGSILTGNIVITTTFFQWFLDIIIRRQWLFQCQCTLKWSSSWNSRLYFWIKRSRGKCSLCYLSDVKQSIYFSIMENLQDRTAKFMTIGLLLGSRWKKC